MSYKVKYSTELLSSTAYLLNFRYSKDNKAYGGHGYGAGGGAGGLYVNNKDWASGFFYGGGNGADGFV